MDSSANCEAEFDQGEIGTPRTGKRGRPPAEIISSLIDEGSRSQHKLKCNHCNRIFPREKSLSAHRRTHTGEKPYICSFPSPKCNKSFAQSGQLKTHERLHTNEKCFKCPVEECSTRYRHSNRKCRKHAHLGLKLIRSPDPNFPQNVLSECSPVVREWLLGFLEKQERRYTPKRPSLQKGKRSCGDRFMTGDGDAPADHPSASRSLHYGSTQVPPSDTDHPDASTHTPEEQDWNSVTLQRRSFGSLSLSKESNGACSSVSTGSSNVSSCNTDVPGEFTSPKDFVSKYGSYNSVISTPQRNNSLPYDHTQACTPVRNSFFSTPKENSHYATPKNKSYLSSVESSYYSTPGGNSTYGTPVGSSNPSTPTSSDYFSTPLAKDLNFPGLGSDLTSTPLASDLFTPYGSAPSCYPHPKSEQGHPRKTLSSPNKRAKSRRGLGPQMEATTNHNVKQEPDGPAYDPRLDNAPPQLSPSLSSLSPSKRVKSRRGLGPLMEATTNSNIKQEPAALHSVEDRLESSMPLSSPSISSSICDENAYLHNENAPPRLSSPSSPQNHALGYRDTHRHQVPPKKMNSYRCFDMDGIKPLNIDESFSPDRYGSNLYANNTKRVHISDNHSSPSFTRHAYPARVAMEMTADFFGNYSSPTEQEVSSPGAQYDSADAYSSALPAHQQSKLRATLLGDCRYSPLAYNQRAPHNTGHNAVAPDVSVRQPLLDTLPLSAYSPQTREKSWAFGSTKQSSDCDDRQDCDRNIHLTYNNRMLVTGRGSFPPYHPAPSSHSKKVSFAMSLHPTDIPDYPDNDSYSATDSFTDEEEGFANYADPSSSASSYIRENVYLQFCSIDDECLEKEENCPVNLSRTSLTCNTTLEGKYSRDIDCPTIEGVSFQSVTERSETLSELDMSVMAPPVARQGALQSEQVFVAKPCTPTKQPSLSLRNFSPRKVVPKKRWMSRIRSQVSAASACTLDTPSQELQPRASVLCLALQQLHKSVDQLPNTRAQPQRETVEQHTDSDSQPLNLSTR